MLYDDDTSDEENAGNVWMLRQAESIIGIHCKIHGASKAVEI